MKKKSIKVEEAPAPYATKKAVKAGKSPRQLTAIVRRENDGFVSLCPELDVASQGGTVKTARANLVEAVALFLEAASPAEIAQRLREIRYATSEQVRKATEKVFRVHHELFRKLAQ